MASRVYKLGKSLLSTLQKDNPDGYRIEDLTGPRSVKNIQEASKRYAGSDEMIILLGILSSISERYETKNMTFVEKIFDELVGVPLTLPSDKICVEVVYQICKEYRESRAIVTEDVRISNEEFIKELLSSKYELRPNITRGITILNIFRYLSNGTRQITPDDVLQELLMQLAP